MVLLQQWSPNYYQNYYTQVLFYYVTTQTQMSQLTLQGVKDGKEIHEWQVKRSPGKEGKAPSEAQEDGYPRHTACILQCGAVKHILRVLPLYPTQLDQHHNKHDEVEQKNDTEIGHHCHVESNVVFQPAAVGDDRDGRQTRVSLLFCAGFISRMQIKRLSEDSQLITGAIRKLPIGDKTVVILVNRDDNNDHNHRDPPADQRELQHVA